MSIINRIIKIVKNEVSAKMNKGNQFDFLSAEQLDSIIADDRDDELRNIINNLKSEVAEYPTEVINAFKTLGINPTSDINNITTAFRNLIKKHHPDNFAKAPQEEQTKNANHTKSIIEAFDIIKNFFAKSK